MQTNILEYLDVTAERGADKNHLHPEGGHFSVDGDIKAPGVYHAEIPADETGAPAENETGTENGEPPAEVWTEPPPEDMPEPGPAEDPDPDPVLDPAEPLPEDGGQEAA